MSSEPSPPPTSTAAAADLEAERLRERIAELELERVDALARAHDQIAAAQDRAYWLDRWGIDLNALMRKRGAGAVRHSARLAHNLHVLAVRVTRATRVSFREYRAAANDSAGPPPAPAPPSNFERSLPRAPLHAAPVTDLLWERLSPEDAARIEELARQEAGSPDPDDLRRVALSLGVTGDVGSVLECTRLSQAAPPAEVHTMARGPLSAGGSPYYADLVVDGLAAGGARPSPGARWLDLGCSSGRVVRVLAAAYTEVEWHGCDPIPEATEWAAANIPSVRFARSPEHPPLPYDDASFDAAFAISIWSHFSQPAAIAWLREAARIVRPGGALLLTAHGPHSIRHAHEHGTRSPAQLAEIRTALYEHGHWFRDEFSDTGDHGIVNRDWGTAFASPEWLLASLGDDWGLAAFAPGRVESDQDMYVLTRR